MAVAVNDILDLAEARLSLITTGNEYNTTAKKIERSRLTPWKGYDLPGLNYWATGLRNTRDQYGGEERAISLLVEYHSKTHDEPFITLASKLAADVVTALNRATTAPKVSDTVSLDIGGVVSDLVFDGYDYEIGEGQSPWCGVMVKFTIKYNADTNDMTAYSA